MANLLAFVLLTNENFPLLFPDTKKWKPPSVIFLVRWASVPDPSTEKKEVRFPSDILGATDGGYVVRGHKIGELLELLAM